MTTTAQQDKQLLAYVEEVFRSGRVECVGALLQRQVFHALDFPVYWLELDDRRVVADSFANLRRRALALESRMKSNETKQDTETMQQQKGLTRPQMHQQMLDRITKLEKELADSKRQAQMERDVLRADAAKSRAKVKALEAIIFGTQPRGEFDPADNIEDLQERMTAAEHALSCERGTLLYFMGKTQDKDRATFRVAEARLDRAIRETARLTTESVSLIRERLDALELPWWKRWLR